MARYRYVNGTHEAILEVPDGFDPPPVLRVSWGGDEREYWSFDYAGEVE